jgi:hypothetical protein
MTKFAPVLLAPMLATYGSATQQPEDDSPSRALPPLRRDGRRSAIAFIAAFATASALAMLWPAIDPGLGTFWERTIGYQAGRESPFSIWGQVSGLEPLRVALLAAVGALAIVLAFRPRRKSLVQVAALGAALLIGIQLTAQHWFYLYIVWFYPLLLLAMAALRRPERAPASSPAQSSRRVPAS